MIELSYSFHVGSDKNRTKTARKSAKENVSGTSSKGNNAIKNINDLAKAENHNLRKYDNQQDLIEILVGTRSIKQDVRNIYFKEFKEAQDEYNVGKKPSRQIKNYYRKISDDNKTDLAAEIILQIGDMDFWENKSDNYRKQMTTVFKEQIEDLKEAIPDFKIANVVIHYDETSPHLHIIGVPVKIGGKNGMKKQVAKSEIFTAESLSKAQDILRNKCINSFNKVYGTNYILKEKEEGRNYDYHVKNMTHYKRMEKHKENYKQRLKEAHVKIDEFAKDSTNVTKILDELRPANFNKDNIIISKKQLDEVKAYVKKSEDTASSMKNVDDITALINTIEKDYEDNIFEYKQLRSENKNLKQIIEIKDDDIKQMKKTIFSLEDQVNLWKDKFKKIINFLKEKLFPDKANKNKRDMTYHIVVEDLKNKGALIIEDYNDIQKGIDNSLNKTKEKDDFER